MKMYFSLSILLLISTTYSQVVDTRKTVYLKSAKATINGKDIDLFTTHARFEYDYLNKQDLVQNYAYTFLRPIYSSQTKTEASTLYESFKGLEHVFLTDTSFNINFLAPSVSSASYTDATKQFTFNFSSEGNDVSLVFIGDEDNEKYDNRNDLITLIKRIPSTKTELKYIEA